MNYFSGGAKLEAYLKRVAERVANPATLRVGFMEGATYPDGTSVAKVAAVQEFGSEHVPARPFFRNMIADKSAEWPAAMAGLLQRTQYDATAALQLMGEGIKGQLQQSIIDTNTPPLSPKTIARKGSEKPLIDTGHMLQSVDAEVVGASS